MKKDPSYAALKSGYPILNILNRNDFTLVSEVGSSYSFVIHLDSL
jgi:hypothetical protein